MVSKLCILKQAITSEKFMLENKTKGIYVPSEKTFFYLETGDYWSGNSIDRIKKTLIQRSLIHISLDGKPSSYSIITYSDFSSKYPTYEVKPIYISKHIESMIHEDANAQAKLSGRFKT